MCRVPAGPAHHSYWACALGSASHNYWRAHTWSPRSATREAATMRSLRITMKSGPCSPQLEKAWAQHEDPTQPKNKQINKEIYLKKKKKEAHSGLALVHWLLSNKKSPLRAGPHVPYARQQKRPSLGLLHPWPPASLRIWCTWGSHDPSSHTTSAPGPHRGRPKSSKADSGQDSCRWTTYRAGDKTKAEPQGWGD